MNNKFEIVLVATKRAKDLKYFQDYESSFESLNSKYTKNHKKSTYKALEEIENKKIVMKLEENAPDYSPQEDEEDTI